MMSVLNSGRSKVLGNGIGSPVVTVNSSSTLFQPGTIEATDRSLDVAINGDGFFNVIGEDGTTYLTRNGGFDLDTEGYLVLPGVGRVLGSSGYIKASGTGVNIASDGTVTGPKGAVLGKILVTSPADYGTMERTENGMFTFSGAAPVSTNYQLLQSSLEKSNVNMNIELTNLVAAQRAFQSCSSALTTVDTLNRRAAQQIAAL